MGEEPPAMPDRVLKDRLSGDAFESLASWCADTECSIQFVNWLGGKSGAVVAEVFLEDDRGVRKAVLKYCPSRPGRKSRDYLAYRNALRSAPKFAENHLVKFDPGVKKPIADRSSGSFLMMEYRNQGSLGYTTMAPILDRDFLGSACKAIVTQVLGKWNEVEGMPKLRSGGIMAQDFLKEILDTKCEVGGPVRSAIELLEASNPNIYATGSGQELPSPLAAVTSGANIAGVRLSGICGNAHGDLHEENILIPAPKDKRPSAREFNRFLLIDLSDFRNNRLLAVDPVNLLLSISARRLPDISEHGRSRLADLIFDPDGAECGGVPAELVKAVQAIHMAGTRFAESRRLFSEWHSETLAAIAACGLMFVGWSENDNDRRWFLVLAARAISLLGGVPSVSAVSTITGAASTGISDSEKRERVPRLSVVPPDGPAPSSPGNAVAGDEGKSCARLVRELIHELGTYEDDLAPGDAVTATTPANAIVEELSIALDKMQRRHDVRKAGLYVTYTTAIGSAQVRLGEVSKILDEIREQGTSPSVLEDLSDAAELLLDVVQDIGRIDNSREPPDS